MLPGENILQAQTDVHVAVPSYSLLDHAEEGGRVKLIGTPFHQVHSSAAVFVSFCLLLFVGFCFCFVLRPDITVLVGWA